MEALKSSLLGMFEKKRIIGMYKFINDCVLDNPMTWDGFDINEQPMKDLFEKFGLEENTIDFLGHAIAL